MALPLLLCGCNDELPEASAGQGSNAQYTFTQPSHAGEAVPVEVEKPEPPSWSNTGLQRSMSSGLLPEPEESSEPEPSEESVTPLPSTDRLAELASHHEMTLDAMERAELTERERNLLDMIGAVSDMVNSNLELHRVRNNGKMPDMDTSGWSAIDTPRLRRDPPQNPFTPKREHSTVIAPSIDDIGPKTGWALDRKRALLKLVMPHDAAIRFGLVDADAEPGVEHDVIVTY